MRALSLFLFCAGAAPPAALPGPTGLNERALTVREGKHFPGPAREVKNLA